MKKYYNLLAIILSFILIGCTTNKPLPPPTWNANTEQLESEYIKYLASGTASISGQAFLTQRGGGVVYGAGRNVTLDPVTTIGNEWWGKAGKIYVFRSLVPPSPNFLKARRTVVANAEGRFKFTDIPEGEYFIRTEITWEVGGYYSTQGGLVGQIVEVKANQSKEVILNQFTK